MEHTGALNQCRNCGNEFAGKFCNQCGEKVFNAHDKTFSHIFEETFHFLTHFEGKFFHTVKTIFRHPGKLSTDYCSGITKRYYKPTSLYLLVVIVYLLIPVFRGLNMPMKSYAEGRFSGYAKTAIRQKMEDRKISYYQVAERFKNKSNITSKFILLLILPVCSLGLMVLFLGKKRLLFDHFILSIEINTFFIIATFLLLPIPVIALQILLPALAPYINDNLFFTLYFVVVPIFCAIAFKRFYNTEMGGALAKGVLFTIFHVFIVFFLYRITLFHAVMALI